MPRPSFFKEKKPEVLNFVRGLSKDYRQKGDPLSLNLITKKLRQRFKFLPPPPKPWTPEELKADKKRKNPRTDPLKLVVYRLCNSNTIWFGDPEVNPSRMKTATPKKTKKS
jgi:hypothetical protein